jgi:catechol 2,3-dioxygenase-like lactoylglutathione lyase family enzyme
LRLDHIAYRVANREETTNFFVEALGYRIEDEFQIDFDDGSCAQCYALTPAERKDMESGFFSAWSLSTPDGDYHMSPEIFVSEGTNNSIVREWVDKRNGIGGIHHIAYQVDDVGETMNEWATNGWATFTTDEPIVADGLSQCFTNEHPLTGVIYEFISRTKKGFNIDSVRDLMKSTGSDE